MITQTGRGNSGPIAAAWRHLDARDGFEVLVVRRTEDGLRCEGEVAPVEEGVPWAIGYSLILDSSWATRSAQVISLSPAGRSLRSLEADGSGGWRVDGDPAPELAGCLDVDLEASAFTNALPIHRLGLAIEDAAEAPAAYVRAPGLEVERLEQSYRRLADTDDGRTRYDYRSPAFQFRAALTYDASGLVVDYPGLALRVA